MAIDDSKNPLKDGPFGYIDKGTFFEDAPLNGQFPESIEVVYQVRTLRLHAYKVTNQKNILRDPLLNDFFTELFRVSYGP